MIDYWTFSGYFKAKFRFVKIFIRNINLRRFVTMVEHNLNKYYCDKLIFLLENDNYSILFHFLPTKVGIIITRYGTISK